MDTIFKIRIPGPFVVLQGVPGDGMANTIDSCPEEDVDEILMNTNQTNDHQQHPHNIAAISGPIPRRTNSSSSLLGLAHSTAPIVAATIGLMPTTTTPTTVPSTAVAPLPTVSVASASPAINNNISDDDANNNNNIQNDNLIEWKKTCRQKEIAHEREWWEQNHRVTGKQQQKLQIQHKWWIDQNDGYLIKFDRLPTKLGILPNKIGKLYPGTTIVATDFITLQSSDYQPALDALAILEKKTRSDNNVNSTIQPSPRIGWIQFIKLDDDTYTVYSVDGYNYISPGLPEYYCNNNINIWRVTCTEGAFVRTGLDLTTKHLLTIPYGSLVQVQCKTINDMALTRLQIQIPKNMMNNDSSSTNNSDKNDDDDSSSNDDEYITGWISEFLNPLSGQRGPIVQPLPFPVPALYRVILDEGAVIRSDIELSSPIIGHADYDAIVQIIGRSFSEHPMEKCIERYKLSGGYNAGWISSRLNTEEEKPIIQFVSVDSTQFDPSNPGLYHIQAMKNLRLQFRPNQHHHHNNTYTNNNNNINNDNNQEQAVSTISSIGDSDEIHNDNDNDNESTSTLSSSCNSNNNNNDRPSKKPSCTYSAYPTNTANKKKHGQKNNNNSQQQQHNKEDRCLICLCEERTATIVHGGTGHIVCCLVCARILKARGDCCPVCRLPIDLVIQHFWA